MGTIEKRSSPIYRQVEAYEESWKKDHDAVKECWTLEDTIAVGLSTGLLIERADHTWRERVFRGAEAYRDEDNDFHRALFAIWLRVTQAVLAEVSRLEQVYGSVSGASELRRTDELIRARLAGWQPPKLSAAVGLREMELSAEEAAELDRILRERKQT